jgi:hypothetical protein
VTNTFERADSPGSSDRRPATALQAIANRCAAGSCPTIYRTDSDAASVVVQGFIVPAEHSGVDVPEGEALVEIPVELLTEAMRHLP